MYRLFDRAFLPPFLDLYDFDLIYSEYTDYSTPLLGSGVIKYSSGYVGFSRLPNVQRHGQSQCGPGQETKHCNWMIIPVRWILTGIFTNGSASFYLGRAEYGIEPITVRFASSIVVSEKRFPWVKFNTTQLLCVLIVRI